MISGTRTDLEEESGEPREDERCSISSTSHCEWKSTEASQDKINVNEAPCVSPMLSHPTNMDADHDNNDDDNRCNVNAAEEEEVEQVDVKHQNENQKDKEWKAEIPGMNLKINEYENKLNLKDKELQEKDQAFKEMKANNELLQNQVFALQSKMMQKECECESKCHKKENQIKTLQEKLEFLKDRVSKIGKIDLCKSLLMHITVDYRKLKKTVEVELDRKHQDFICMANTIRTALMYSHQNMLHFNLLQEQHSERAQQQIEEYNEEFRKETDLEIVKSERDELKFHLMKLTMAYQKEKKLRKQLLEQIIDLKGNIRVFCRVRPKIQRKVTDKNATEGETPSPSVLMATTCLDDERVVINSESKKYFSFDQVYPPETSQETIFQDVRPLIHSAVDGYNVCIFAYGQTGSGKTYTMEGTREHPGIIYESFEELFKLKATANTPQTNDAITENENEMEMKVYLSCLEIYNEKIRDLLVDVHSNSVQSKINPFDLKAKLSKCGKKVLVPGLTKIEVRGTDNVRDILHNVAYKNRSTGVTNMNEHSSRSHALVFVDIATKQSSSRLVLIDLAGSERVKKTGVFGTAFDEARNINKSLSALGNVISALQSRQKHIPFRDSQLTYLLYDCLGGNSRALMFCNISCEVFDIKESINTLTFAHRVRRVELGEAQKNENPNVGTQDSAENEEKQNNLEMLKQKIKKYQKDLDDKEKEIRELKVSSRNYKKEISKLTSSIAAQNRKIMKQKEHSRLSQEMDQKMVMHKNYNSHNHSGNNKIPRPRIAAITTTNVTTTQKVIRNTRKRKQQSKGDEKDNRHNVNTYTGIEAPAQKRRKINQHSNANTNKAAGRTGEAQCDSKKKNKAGKNVRKQ